MVGLVFKITGSTWDGWANILSLSVFATGLWPFLQLARRYVGERAAWWSLSCLLAQPLIVLTSGQAGTDGLCLVTIIWFLYFADRLIREEAIVWLIPTTVFASLCAISKLPFFLTAGLCSIGMLVAYDVRSARRWILLAVSGLVAAGVFFLWTAHTNRLAGEAEFPFTDLRLSHSPWLAYWYFGDLEFRLKPGAWLKGAWRFIHGTLGSLPLAVLLVVGVLRPGNQVLKAAAFVTTLLFTNLVLAHWHYYLMCAPAVAMLCGVVITTWNDALRTQLSSANLRTWLLALGLFLAAAEGLAAMKLGADLDPFPRQMSQVIREHTQPADKLLVHNYHLIWGGEVLFRSQRQGLVVSSLDGGPRAPSPYGLRTLLAEEKHLQRLKELGYTKLVLISESPVQHATIALAASGEKRERGRYPTSISPQVDHWPSVFASEDILIKRIP